MINFEFSLSSNGARYRDMKTNALLLEIEARYLNDIWFQQEGATCHTTRDPWLYYENHFL